LNARVAAHLNIPHVLCTEVQVDDSGALTGEYKRPACYGAGKVHWAEDFARRHGISLAHSHFYSDSFSDRPMLERVGHAYAINPDPRLKRFARARGWPIEEWSES
jgi:phosphoserine phosphatase